MNTTISKLIAAPLLVLALLLNTPASAQGTSNGPITFHDVANGITGPFVPVGPMGIDLDPTGKPWTKYVYDDEGFLNRASNLAVRERIVNLGDEPWLDWHEHILPGPTGSWGVWNSVQLLINGTPIAFNVSGIGTTDLWLDGFSQPVLPGDTLTINKSLSVREYVQTPGAPVLLIQEYPTPEPASAALMGLGATLLMARRKGAPRNT